MLLCEVLNEAVGVLVYGSLSLEREDLLQFKSLRVIVSLGVCGSGNVDVATASQLGVCVCVCVYGLPKSHAATACDLEVMRNCRRGHE